MLTRRARSRDPIARVALFGALALAVVFGGLAVETANPSGRSADVHHAVILPRDARPVVAVATSGKSRGSAWFASLFAACAFFALAGFALRAVRGAGYRRATARFSVRLRAPPAFSVAR